MSLPLDDQPKVYQIKNIALRIAAAALLVSGVTGAALAGPTDPQIAHIAYTAGNIDIAAGK